MNKKKIYSVTVIAICALLMVITAWADGKKKQSTPVLTYTIRNQDGEVISTMGVNYATKKLEVIDSTKPSSSQASEAKTTPRKKPSKPSPAPDPSPNPKSDYAHNPEPDITTSTAGEHETTTMLDYEYEDNRSASDGGYDSYLDSNSEPGNRPTSDYHLRAAGAFAWPADY